MPELPEVETFVRGLQPTAGAVIRRVQVLDSRLEIDPEDLLGRRIVTVRRRGKHIIIELDDEQHLVIHLRMSGRLRRSCAKAEIPYTRMVIHLSTGDAVYFVNPRRLGTVRICREGFDDALGVEPLSEAFTPEHLAGLLRSTSCPVKVFLLDQHRIAGIGNIYAAEALWRAGLSPLRPTNTLSSTEVDALHTGIVSVLREAIDQLGTSIGDRITDYRPQPETQGQFGNALAVYGREGVTCSRCQHPIQRIQQGGRSTFYCASCQT